MVRIGVFRNLLLAWASSQQMHEAMKHCPVLQTRCLPAEFCPDYAYLIYHNHVCEHDFTPDTALHDPYTSNTTARNLCSGFDYCRHLLISRSTHPLAFRVHCCYSWHCHLIRHLRLCCQWRGCHASSQAQHGEEPDVITGTLSLPMFQTRPVVAVSLHSKWMNSPELYNSLRLIL